MTPTPRAVRRRSLVAVALALIGIMIMPVDTARLEKGFWTRRDLDRVADAAVAAAAAAGNTATHIFMLSELANALKQAGNVERAKAIALKADRILGPSNDFMHSPLASHVIEKLTQPGDIPDTELFAKAAAGNDTHATLLGKSGEAQARAGDVGGALKTMGKTTALPDAGPKPMPAATNADAMASSESGGAFEARRETEIVLKVVDSFPVDYQKINLLTRVGKRLCASADSAQVAKGRLVAEQAAHAALAALNGDLMPYEKRNGVVTAAEALETCGRPDVARGFLHDTLPALQIIMALSMTADNFAQKGEARLAQAMASPVDPNGFDSLPALAKRSLKRGDLEAAKVAATQASATTLGLYRATLPMDPINRAQFYLSVVQSEIENDDAAAVARTVPTIIEAVKTPALQPILVRMTLALTQSQYYKESKTALEALRAAWDAFLPADPRNRPPDALAGVQGILAEADHADRFAVKLSRIMAAAMSFANATTSLMKTEIEKGLRQAQGGFPSSGSGPKAGVLGLIASDLALTGGIDSELLIQTGPEGEARDSLQSMRDTALVAISEAQARANDPKGSLATTLHIEQPLMRWEPLLRLAAIMPNS